MRIQALVAAGVAALLCSGCGASIGNMTTGSLFGGSSAAPAAPQVVNDPTARAMQVGTTSARAQKCGFNFDPVRLRTQFLATESPALTNPADAAKLAQIYDTSLNGLSKAVAGQGQDYCSADKTRKIKEALNRHLAGDYTPTPPEPVEEEAGIFGDLGSSSSPGIDHTMKHPAEEN
jgi:hypothetical protein